MDSSVTLETQNSTKRKEKVQFYEKCANSIERGGNSIKKYGNTERGNFLAFEFAKIEDVCSKETTRKSSKSNNSNNAIGIEITCKNEQCGKPKIQTEHDHRIIEIPELNKLQNDPIFSSLIKDLESPCLYRNF